jgi:hypothetical protein
VTNKPLLPGDIAGYILKWNGTDIARPAANLTSHRYTVPNAGCARTTDTITMTAVHKSGHEGYMGTGHPDRDKCPATVTPPTGRPLPPQNFRVTVLSTSGTTIGGRVQCDPMARVESVRLFVINADGTLGNRLATYLACGGIYPKFVAGRSYVLKFVYRDGKLSDRSNVVRL